MNRVHARVFARVGVKSWQTLPQYTSIGSYTIIYYAKDGSEFCAKCAKDSDTGERIMHADVYWEGEPIQCAHCGKDIESSYGSVES